MRLWPRARKASPPHQTPRRLGAENLESRLVPSGTDFVQTNLVSDIAGLAVNTFDLS